MAKSKKGSSGPSGPKPKSDAYVGLLVVSLLAQIAGAVLLYLEYSSYPDKGPPKIMSAPVAAAQQPQNPAPQPPAPMPPAPMPMPMPPAPAPMP